MSTFLVDKSIRKPKYSLTRLYRTRIFIIWFCFSAAILSLIFAIVLAIVIDPKFVLSVISTCVGVCMPLVIWCLYASITDPDTTKKRAKAHATCIEHNFSLEVVAQINPCLLTYEDVIRVEEITKANMAKRISGSLL